MGIHRGNPCGRVRLNWQLVDRRVENAVGRSSRTTSRRSPRRDGSRCKVGCRGWAGGNQGAGTPGQEIPTDRLIRSKSNGLPLPNASRIRGYDQLPERRESQQ